MVRNINRIIKLDDTIKKRFIIYEMNGCGVVESPNVEGKTLEVIDCTEFEAYMYSEVLNFKKYGTLIERSSWNSPTIHYKNI